MDQFRDIQLSEIWVSISLGTNYLVDTKKIKSTQSQQMYYISHALLYL